MWPFSNPDVRALKREVVQLREDLTVLQASYERLRGRLYATGQHRPPEASSAPKTKGEILREAGFTPGRPMKHDT